MVFTKTFSPASLIVVKAAAANFQHANLSGKNTNMLVTLYSLNLGFYKNPAWGLKPASGGYWPQPGAQSNYPYIIKTKQGTEEEKHMNITPSSDYLDTINYSKGWFKSEFLQAVKLGTKTSPTALHQIVAGRYNPNIDDGSGNEIYCATIVGTSWLPPAQDKQLLITDMPLWLGLYG